MRLRFMAYILCVEDGEIAVADKLVTVKVVLAHARAVQEVLESPSAGRGVSILVACAHEDAAEGGHRL